MTSHMQVPVIGLEAQCGFMPGKSTIDAIFTMRVSLQKRFRFQKDSWVLFVDFAQAFDTVPPSREMLLKVLARLGFPPKIVNLVRVFHENVTGGFFFHESVDLTGGLGRSAAGGRRAC